jgi:hypothetical protein
MGVEHNETRTRGKVVNLLQHYKFQFPYVTERSKNFTRLLSRTLHRVYAIELQKGYNKSVNKVEEHGNDRFAKKRA